MVFLLVTGVAFIVRLVHLLQLSHAPFWPMLMGDAEAYDRWALDIAGGNWFGSGVFYQAPLYPYFLGMIYRVFGHSLWAVRLIQALLGSLACGFLAAAATRLFSRTAGLVAGVVMALYAPAIFFDGLIQKSAVDMFLACLLLWLVAGQIVLPRRGAWCWIGIVLGGLMLTRENSALWAAILLGWLWLGCGLSRREKLICSGLLLAGLSLILLPVGARNGVVGGEFHLTTAQFGPNFYIGNNPRANGTYQPLRPGRGSFECERRDATDLAEQAMGKKLSPREVSRYWAAQSFRYIASQPGHWARLMLRKVGLLCNRTEIVDTEDLGTHAEHSTLLNASRYVLHFGVLAPWGILGCWIVWQDRRKLLPFYVLLVAYAASVVLFYVFARYRYPLVPFLVLFAAGGLAGLRSFLRRASRGEIIAVGLTGLAAIVFCNWPMFSDARMRCTTRLNIAQAYAIRGDLDAAVREYGRALQLDPHSAEAHSNLAGVLMRQHQTAQSITHAQLAVQSDPAYAPAYRQLALLYKAQGKYREALAQLARASQVDPGHAATEFEMGQTLNRAGDPAHALAHYREALRLGYRSAVLFNNMAWIQATRPDADPAAGEEAVEWAKQACALAGDGDASMLDTLAVAWAAAGRFEEAIATAERAIQSARQSPAAISVTTQMDQRIKLYRQGKPYRAPRPPVDLEP